MRRYIIAGLSVGVLMLAWILWPDASPGQGKKAPAGGDNQAAGKNGSPLPLTHAVFFSSGVAYFERSGIIEGNVTMDLSFPADNVNDLLKSLVLQDHGGGQISTVSYDSQDPVEKTLKSFALDLTRNPTYAQLLFQARGEKVEIEWQGQTLKGTVVGTEHEKQLAGKDTIVEVEFVNIQTAEGLRRLPLNQVQRVKFQNTHLEGELKRALDVLAMSHDTHKRTVRISFTGNGKRSVRVGYVIENPIWKTSYRLVLDKDEKPFLQGWAIVDNATDEDWKDVQVTLVSGPPISFRMDLYTPLYVPRPVMEPELFAGLRPQTYGGEMPDSLIAKEKDAKKAEGKSGRGQIDVVPVPGGYIIRGTGKKQIEDAGKELDKAEKRLELARGITAQVATEDLGDFFQYVIKHPVSIARQKSALLPIVNEKIEAARFSIFNTKVHPKYPLLGLKLKNTTDLHLMQGPITVFEGASYAGDAYMLDLRPKEERLISYAVDLGTEAETVAKTRPEQLIGVKIVKGTLHATYKLRQPTTYNVKNRGGHDRQVLIEHPIHADWKLISPEKPSERSRDVYRFQVKAAPGKDASQEVVEELSRVDQIVLTTANDPTIALYLRSEAASPKVKKALEHAVALKNKLGATQLAIADVEKEIKRISDDQVRLRANMERVPQNSAPYQRYLKKLDEQETQIDTLQERTRTLRRQEDEQRREYEAYLLGLDME